MRRYLWRRKRKKSAGSVIASPQMRYLHFHLAGDEWPELSVPGLMHTSGEGLTPSTPYESTAIAHNLPGEPQAVCLTPTSAAGTVYLEDKDDQYIYVSSPEPLVPFHWVAFWK